MIVDRLAGAVEEPNRRFARIGGSRPLVAAHRGASAYAPENTLTAFVLATEMGAEMIELDVRLSADGQLVVVHDAELARTTDGQGYVHEWTMAELRRLDAGFRFSRDGGKTFPFRGLGLGLCSLHEVLAIIPRSLTVNVELKSLPGDPDFDPERERIAAAVIRLLQNEPEQVERVLVSSFNRRALEAVKVAGLGARTGVLVPPSASLARALEYVVAFDHDALHPHESALAGEGLSVVAGAQERGIEINAWTVDEPPRMRELIIAGVDAIMTNRPDVLTLERAAIWSQQPVPSA